ncbi:MAG: hypothetical protein M3R18_01235, partial [Pseudomonadota bacterium]|nr:hypothetical protein [Pseudomonadota bacterium]
RWVSLHGIAINVDPDLSHFAGIVPCGVREARYGVTSLADLGLPVTMAELDAALAREFEALFGPAPTPSPRLRGEGRGEGDFPGAQTGGNAPSPDLTPLGRSPIKSGTGSLPASGER